jgi:hypothetical protein
MQKLKERTVYLVSGGRAPKWFTGELGARDYASDRYEDADGPVPFVKEVTLSEAFNRLNELERANE